MAYYQNTAKKPRYLVAKIGYDATKVILLPRNSVELAEFRRYLLRRSSLRILIDYHLHARSPAPRGGRPKSSPAARPDTTIIVHGEGRVAAADRPPRGHAGTAAAAAVGAADRVTPLLASTLHCRAHAHHVYRRHRRDRFQQHLASQSRRTTRFVTSCVWTLFNDGRRVPRSDDK